jgi:hypothetical protein
MVEGGQRAVFIDVESGGRPVRAPCPIWGPLNPGGPTPRRRLLIKKNIKSFYLFLIKIIINIYFIIELIIRCCFIIL